MFPDANLSAGPHQALPFVRGLLHSSCEQNLDTPSKKIPGDRIVRTDRLRPQPRSPTIQPRRKHPSIVEHYEIARPQQFGKIAELAIVESAARRFPGRAVQVQQARPGAVCQRRLRR